MPISTHHEGCCRLHEPLNVAPIDNPVTSLIGDGLFSTLSTFVKCLYDFGYTCLLYWLSFSLSSARVTVLFLDFIFNYVCDELFQVNIGLVFYSFLFVTFSLSEKVSLSFVRVAFFTSSYFLFFKRSLLFRLQLSSTVEARQNSLF